MQSGKSIGAQIFVGSIIAIIVLIGLYFISGKDKEEVVDTGVSVEEGTTKDTAKGKVMPSPSNPDEKVEYASTEWVTHGGDYYNRRYSMLNQITSENIGDLKPTWVSSLGSGAEDKYSGEATPIVVDGIMYIATGANDVFAMDAKTGEKIWAYTPDIPQEMDTVCCGWTTRGVAVGDGKVYVGLLDARLSHLIKKQGK